MIVIQEIFGIDEYVRRDVDRWASLGFEAVAPVALRPARTGLRIARHDEAGMQGRHRPRHGQRRRNRPWPTSPPAATTGAAGQGVHRRLLLRRVHSLAGGRASSDGLAAGSSYYGSRVQANATLTPKCPTIVHFGRKDAAHSGRRGQGRGRGRPSGACRSTSTRTPATASTTRPAGRRRPAPSWPASARWSCSGGGLNPVGEANS